MPHVVVRYAGLAAWVVLIIVIVVLYHTIQDVQATADETHRAGCAQQRDLRDRAHGTLALIKSLRPGTKQVVFGDFTVDVATLATQAASQLAYAKTLDKLHCQTTEGSG